MPGPAENALSPEERAVVDRFRAAGQGHVFRFLDELSPEARRTLMRQAETVDLELVERLSREVLAESGKRPSLAPLDPVGPDHPRSEEARSRGRALFGEGRVAFFTVAGGQGSRLGFDGPKGAYPIGPFSGKTLFEWHAEKVLAAAARYGRQPPWVILVSETNETATKEFFDRHDRFGLGDEVRFVCQRMLPAVGEQGNILLRSPGEIFLSPNGHGGSIDALGRGGILPWLRERGIEYVSYFQVDNALLNAADPCFVGHQALTGAEMTAKVVRKRTWDEPAGVVVVRDGRPGVVEYSEIVRDDAQRTDESGELLYGLANVAAHGFTVEFLERLQGAGLPYHAAVKDVETVDESGRPKTVKGRKFETFVFDAIPRARGFIAYLTEREEEFAPLKEREGENTPETVRSALLGRTRRWFERAGEPAPEGDKLEMSPLQACDYETFCDWLAGRGPGR